MKHLLIVAHGSRRQASNDEVRELTARIRDIAGDAFASVDCAFLELAEPSIPDGLRCSIDRGATHIVVSPYFLSAGRHVVTDIPGEVAVVQQHYPNVNIEIAPYLGALPSMAQLILDQVNTSISTQSSAEQL